MSGHWQAFFVLRGRWLERGARVDASGETLVVTSVDHATGTVTFRGLRWYERLWAWVRRKVGR